MRLPGKRISRNCYFQEKGFRLLLYFQVFKTYSIAVVRKKAEHLDKL